MVAAPRAPYATVVTPLRHSVRPSTIVRQKPVSVNSRSSRSSSHVGIATGSSAIHGAGSWRAVAGSVNRESVVHPVGVPPEVRVRAVRDVVQHAVEVQRAVRPGEAQQRDFRELKPASPCTIEASSKWRNTVRAAFGLSPSSFHR